MLTIQPKVVNLYPKMNQTSFKGGEAAALDIDNDEALFEKKTQYYKHQINEFDKSLNDKYTPSSFKKVIKIFKVVSEALLEGWAVAWGASKGSKIIKSTVVKEMNSKTAKGLEEVLTPFGKKLKKAGLGIGTAIKNGFQAIKTSKFVTSAGEKLHNLAERMNKNSIGKYVVKGFEYIGKAFKFAADLVTAGYKRAAQLFEGKTASQIYDKATKATSTTLGVGAGAAGAYNAATGKEKVQENKAASINDEVDETIVDDVNDEFEKDLKKGLDMIEDGE